MLQTVRVDPNPAQLRDKWRTAKNKHAGVIAANKIKFNKDLGPLLDKRVDFKKKVLAWQKTKGGQNVIALEFIRLGLMTDCKNYKENGKTLKKAAETYLERIEVLDNDGVDEETKEANQAAKEELETLLQDILRRATNDIAMANQYITKYGRR
jgi:hypothetical protein